MPEPEVAQHLVDTAHRIEHRRQVSERRILIIIVAIQIAMFLLILAFGFGAWIELRSLLEGVEEQNTAQLVAIEENRQAALRADAAQDRILVAIGDRLVPRAEVKRLERQTRRLRRTVRELRRSVQALNRTLARSNLSGG
jgi:cell division protein FtsB